MDNRSHTAPSPHVLAVDDEAINLMVLEAALAPLGYRIQSASSAEEAMRLMRGETPDLVLLDVMMPGQTGIELCQSMRRNQALANVPVVLVTALAADAARGAGLSSGADDYLEKPIDIDELIERVRSIVARTQGRMNTAASSAAASSRRNAERQARALGIEGSTAARIGLETMVHEAAVAVGGNTEINDLASAMARAAGLEIARPS